MKIEMATPANNILVRPDRVTNRMVGNTDFVFSYFTDTTRGRLLVKGKHLAFDNPRPRRLRARVVRAAMRIAKKQGHFISWKQTDDAFLGVLKEDGATLPFRLSRAAWFYLTGLLRHGVGYFVVPVKEDPSDDVQEQD